MIVRAQYGFYEVPPPGTKVQVILGPKDELETVTVLGKARCVTFRDPGPGGVYAEQYRYTHRLVEVMDSTGRRRDIAVERFPFVESRERRR